MSLLVCNGGPHLLLPSFADAAAVALLPPPARLPGLSSLALRPPPDSRSREPADRGLLQKSPLLLSSPLLLPVAVAGRALHREQRGRLAPTTIDGSARRLADAADRDGGAENADATSSGRDDDDDEG